MGEFIEDHASELKGSDGKITVAGLVMNNEFGAAYDGGFREWLAKSPIKDSVDYVTEKIEPTAPTVTDAMTTLASKKPQMFIAETAGVSCTQTIVEAAQNGLKGGAKILMFPQTCKTGFNTKDKVGGDGSASDGWWIVGGGLKPLDNASMDTDPYAVQVRKELADGGIDYKKESLTLLGYEYEWGMEQTLLVASQLDGGLTRANFIVALRSMDMTAPYLFEGAKWNMNGNKDAYLTEASEYSKFDAAAQSWIKQGPLVDNSGKTANCAWDQENGKCK